MAKRRGECVYCGQLAALTDDHVPPQAMCSKPRPIDLVVVPACESCNGGSSKDDEYFKTVMVLKDRAGTHPEAESLRPSVIRGLSMSKKIKFTRKLMAGIREVALRTPAGLYAGQGTAFDVDLVRLDRVVERVTRGLYWHHHEHVRLPSDHEVRVWSEEGLGGLEIAEAAEFRRTLVEPVLNNPERSVGRGVLKYRFAVGDRPHVTGWWLEFYDDVRFVAFSGPRLESGA